MDTNPNAPCISIVVYRAKPGKEADLEKLVEEHVPFLRNLGLVTPRPQVIAKSADGAIVEVFEWAQGSLEIAHHHPQVGELWQRFAKACDFAPLNTLPESSNLFTNLVPVN